MTLQHIQKRLQGIYELDLEHCVYDFLITSRELADAQLHSTVDSRETLLVCQEQDELFLSLYLHDGVVRNLEINETGLLLHKDNIEDFFLALEGISHFIYLIWNASFERSVTKLEMEIQAEIDKFIMLSKFVNRQQQYLAPGKLRRLLFESVSYRGGMSQEDIQRYRDANFFAEKYCWFLESRNYLNAGLEQELLKEIRRFYRLNLRGKLQRISYLY